MKGRLLVVLPILFITVPFAFSQKVSTRNRTVEPPQIQTAVDQSGKDASGAVADVLAIEPQMPRGPMEILREYESQMTMISQTFSAEMAVISQAVRQGQITREQADYLIQQRFQIAMMQYEVVNGLHDALAFDLSRTPVSRQAQASDSDTTVVVQPPFPVSSGSSGPRPN